MTQDLVWIPSKVVSAFYLMTMPECSFIDPDGLLAHAAPVCLMSVAANLNPSCL